MAVLVSDVKAILDTSLSDADIQAYITGSTALVTSVLGSSSLSDDLIMEITRWLTAHMIASTREQQLSSAGAGSAKAVFQGVTGMGLDSTLYGQQVKILDTTGAMAALSGKGHATLWAI